MIKLDDNYTIRTDAHNCILEYRNEGDINPKTGNATISSETFYYKDIPDALIAYIRKSGNQAKTLTDIIIFMEAAEARVYNAILTGKR